MNKKSFEVNIDALVGPTHHFGGLAYGNVASTKNKLKCSYPKKAALQGLEKMKVLHDLGIIQMIFPPQPRPNFSLLRRLGFDGTAQEIIKKVFKTSPQLLLSASSSSSMWMANAATITPSSDSKDKKVHITPANLASYLHRSLEVPFTEKIFKTVFKDEHFFQIHAPLPSTPLFYDEGAANHTRFSNQKNSGIHLFVYGRSVDSKKLPSKYPARETKEAQDAICRLHQIPEEIVIFAQQNPKAIDMGIFHNDVIATGHEDFFFVHEDAYINQDEVLSLLQKKSKKLLKNELEIYEVKRSELSFKDAVSSYIFNSQIITTEQGRKILIAPDESRKNKASFELLYKLVNKNYIQEILFLPLNESMQNGGGPACLRCRINLTEEELDSCHKGVLFSHDLYQKIQSWIEKYYPEKLEITDLQNSNFLRQLEEAEKSVLKILKLTHG